GRKSLSKKRPDPDDLRQRFIRQRRSRYRPSRQRRSLWANARACRSIGRSRPDPPLRGRARAPGLRSAGRCEGSRTGRLRPAARGAWGVRRGVRPLLAPNGAGRRVAGVAPLAAGGAARWHDLYGGAGGGGGWGGWGGSTGTGGERRRG